MKVTKDNHYVLAILVVHGFVRVQSLHGTQKDIDRFQATYNSIKHALYQGSCGSFTQEPMVPLTQGKKGK